MKTTFKVPVSYTYSGYYLIKAETAADARKIVIDECGSVGPNIHSNGNEVVEWNFDMHPTKTKIGRIFNFIKKLAKRNGTL